jgi:YD repeat-containing protein
MSGSDGSGVPNTATVTDRHGNQYVAAFDTPGNCGQLPQNPTPPASRIGGGLVEPMIDDTPRGEQFCPQWVGAQQITDSNGNVINGFNPTDNLAPGVDTLGRALPLSAISNVTASNSGNAGDTSGCTDTASEAYLASYNALDSTVHHVKMCYTQLAMQTAFNQPNVIEYPGGPALAPGSDIFKAINQLPTLTTVILTDGTKWAFTYDNFGELISIGLPADRLMMMANMQPFFEQTDGTEAETPPGGYLYISDREKDGGIIDALQINRMSLPKFLDGIPSRSLQEGDQQNWTH